MMKLDAKVQAFFFEASTCCIYFIDRLERRDRHAECCSSQPRTCKAKERNQATCNTQEQPRSGNDERKDAQCELQDGSSRSSSSQERTGKSERCAREDEHDDGHQMQGFEAKTGESLDAGERDDRSCKNAESACEFHSRWSLSGFDVVLGIHDARVTWRVGESKGFSGRTMPNLELTDDGQTFVVGTHHRDDGKGCGRRWCFRCRRRVFVMHDENIDGVPNPQRHGRAVTFADTVTDVHGGDIDAERDPSASLVVMSAVHDGREDCATDHRWDVERFRVRGCTGNEQRMDGSQADEGFPAVPTRVFVR